MKRILLVEDYDDIREALAETLRDHGYEVTEAENGKVALERLEELGENPCLVLLDLMMPVMTGTEMLKCLQQTHRLAALPVVVLSAGGQPSDVPTAKKFIRKPPPEDMLLSIVEEFCRD